MKIKCGQSRSEKKILQAVKTEKKEAEKIDKIKTWPRLEILPQNACIYV